jgi:hypothetical protein
LADVNGDAVDKKSRIIVMYLIIMLIDVLFVALFVLFYVHTVRKSFCLPTFFLMTMKNIGRECLLDFR